LTLADIKNYAVDVSLKSIATQGIHKKMKYRNLLQYIALAGMCVMYVDRSDRFILERLGLEESVDTLTFDNIYKEPQIKLDALVSRIEVSFFDGETENGVLVLESEIKGGAALKIENTLINSEAHAREVAA